MSERRDGMSEQGARAAREVRPSPEAFFWSLVDGNVVRGARDRREALLAMVESDLPLPLEQVHVAVTELADGKVLACGMERERVAQIVQDRGNLQNEVVVLAPAAFAPFVAAAAEEAGIDPRSLNMLTGEFTPKGVARARRVRRGAAAGVLACGLVLAAIGVERRTAYWRAETAGAREASRAMLVEAFGANARPQDLISALRTLRQTRGERPSGGTVDAAVALADFLEGWPTGTGVRVESLVVETEGRGTLIVTADTLEVVQAFGEALRPAVWERVGQPQIATLREEVRMTTRWVWRERGDDRREGLPLARTTAGRGEE